jgi:hypothetical protein
MARPRFVRNLDAGPTLDTFLVFSIGSVLATRGYLVLTGYPQIGGGTLHIAHVLWGGLLMLIAIIVALATIDIAADRLIAAVGGIGFGLFIDEVGKFVTKDVDYFFKPAIAIIYVCFVGLFFVFRYIERGNRMTPETALANALAIIAEASTRTITEAERARAQYLLSRADGITLTPAAATLLAELPTRQPRPSRIVRWIERWLVRPYRRFACSKTFIWLIGLYAAVNLLSVLIIAVGVVLLIPASTRHDAQISLSAGGGSGFTAIGLLVSGCIAAAMMGIGLLRLRRSRLQALVWFDRSYLFSILVVQVFAFAESQLRGVSGLLIDLIVWGAIRIALSQERERTELAVTPIEHDQTEGEPVA